MIPADHVLLATHLLHLFHELLLEDRVDRLDGDCGTHLRHGEDINHRDGVLVHDLAHHEAHNLERHTCATMLHHLEERETGDVDLLTRVWLLLVHAWLGHLTTSATHALHLHQPLQVHFLLLICLNLTKFSTF